MTIMNDNMRQFQGDAIKGVDDRTDNVSNDLKKLNEYIIDMLRDLLDTHKNDSNKSDFFNPDLDFMDLYHHAVVGDNVVLDDDARQMLNKLRCLHSSLYNTRMIWDIGVRDMKDILSRDHL
jgi:hypothetical protein